MCEIFARESAIRTGFHDSSRDKVGGESVGVAVEEMCEGDEGKACGGAYYIGGAGFSGVCLGEDREEFSC
jgi:hypothetical protein